MAKRTPPKSPAMTAVASSNWIKKPEHLIGPGASAVRAAQRLLRRIGGSLPETEGIGAAIDAGRFSGVAPTKPGALLIPHTPAHLVSPRMQNTALVPVGSSSTEQPLVTILSRDAAAALNHAGARRTRLGSSGTEGIAVEEQSLADKLRALSSEMLDVARTSGAALHESVTRISETASYDFCEYRYMRDPDPAMPAGDDLPSTLTVASFISQVGLIISDIIFSYCNRVITLVGPHPPLTSAQVYPVAVTRRLFIAHAAERLFEFACLVSPQYIGSSGKVVADVLAVFGEWLTPRITAASFVQATMQWTFVNPDMWTNCAVEVEKLFMQLHPDARWKPSVGDLPGAFSFTPFPLDVVNFGVRLAYRQQWKPLGTQPGEIVRTIPLGPKQVERISTKTVVTDKVSRTQDSTVSTDSSSESDVTNKDASETVREAAQSSKWHVDGNAGFSLGSFSAGLSAGYEKEQSSSSKDTKSRLNETVSRTATKTNSTVKVAVSSEHSTSDELARCSEITNPNDDLPITYVFSKLQRQYEIVTSLAQVSSVVFIPERMPDYGEIDADWVRRHDWVLRKALLDPSFETDMENLARDVELSEVSPDEEQTAKDSAITARGAMGSFSALPGKLPDIFGPAQAGFHNVAERGRALADAKARRQQRCERLLGHIRQNILHYMRAVWSSEDADQRLRRYARVFVPTKWTFVPAADASTPSEGATVAGTFEPDYGPGSMRRLSDVILPTGLVGFSGNYAVFLMRRDPSLVDLNDALSLLRCAYVRYEVKVTDATADAPIAAWVRDPLHTMARYVLTSSEASSAWTVQALVPGAIPISHPASYDPATGIVQFDGVCVQFNAPPAPGSRFSLVVAATDELEDPELRALRLERPLPLAEAESLVYSRILAEMADRLPDLAGTLTPSANASGWDGLDSNAKALVRANYHRLLLTREHSRRFLMDTNNLVIDVDVGTTTVLEDFKRMHRCIDVLKQLEDLSGKNLDNARRQARLAASELGDPEIENLTVVSVKDSSIQPTVPVVPPPVPRP